MVLNAGDCEKEWKELTLFFLFEEFERNFAV